MMWIRTILLVALATSSWVNTTLISKKICSDIDFCNRLRHGVPDEESRFKLNPDAEIGSETSVEVMLSNNKADQVKLIVSALAGDTFRIQIEEVDSNRYKIVDVLQAEPEVIPIRYVEKTSSGIVLAVNQSSSHHVVITYDPLTINFAQDEVVHTTIEGSRIILENTDQSRAITFSVMFPFASKLYGLHEHTDHLRLAFTNNGVSEPYRFHNLDTPGATTWSPKSNYGAVPFLYGHGVEKTAGIFFHNGAQQFIDTEMQPLDGSKAYFMAEAGSLDIFVLPGPAPRDVLNRYLTLTGKPHLPQLWALGYHQSRYNYESQEDVMSVIANMDAANFPMDTIWLDIDYTDGKRYFTWDPQFFSDPIGMQQNISSTNRKLITIIDPHVKVDKDYPFYQTGTERGVFVKNPDGSDFQGECWPGTSSYVDFLNSESRTYYANMFSYENFPGSTETLAGIWNDMNEPSVFARPETENTMPFDTVHKDDLGQSVQHGSMHNLYGFLQTKATHQGLMSRDNEKKRPFILTRSHFAGSQRYTAFWTGDNVATWTYLAVSFATCATANINGIVFCGADVGGFLNNPTDELYFRWFQAGIWLPFFRSHSDKGTNRREPYLLNGEVQNIVRIAMETRYEHIFVWYTLFYEHIRNGDPLMRPMFYQYPNNPDVLDMDDQFLVGENILVHPIVESMSNVHSVDVYIPEGIWYRVGDSISFEGPKSITIDVDPISIPVFYRGGSIIPLAATVGKSTEDMKDSEFIMIVHLDDNGQAFGSVYLDDFVSFDYQSNNYTYYNMRYENGIVVVTPENPGTKLFKLPLKSIVVNEHQANGHYTQQVFSASRDGTPLSKISSQAEGSYVITL